MIVTSRWMNAIAAAAFLVSAGAAIGGASPLAAQAPIVGGFRDVAVTDPDVRAAARFGVAHLRRPHSRLATIDAAQQQVVAGMNYRIDVTLADRSRWRLTVYRPLRGEMRSTSAARIPPAH